MAISLYDATVAGFLQTLGAVAEWRSKYGRARQEPAARDGLPTIQPRAVRTCGNGEPALPMHRGEGPATQRSDLSAGLRPASPMSVPSIGPVDGFMQGNMMGFSPRDAGQTTLAPPR